jgi:AraC-like DNA-binding protein
MHLRPVGKTRFQSKTENCQVGDLKLMASATTECQIEVEQSHGWHLFIPCASTLVTHCDKHSFEMKASKGALLLPNIKRSGDRGTSAVVVVNFNPGKLMRTRAIMTGGNAYLQRLEDRVHQIEFAQNPQLFRVFLQLCRLIDTTQYQEGLAEQLGLDDMLYRWMATGLNSTERPAENMGRLAAPGRNLDEVCDMIRSAEQQPLTLTELEEVSGLSSRSLQYAFKRRFGCTPMEWQRRERIILAQQRLITIGQDETITTIAHSMGYSSSAAFAALYKRHFGETPSQTIARSVS